MYEAIESEPENEKCSDQKFGAFLSDTLLQ